MLEDTESTTDFESDKKLKMYYHSCSNEALREELGVKPLQKMLKRLGGWPVIEGSNWANEKTFKWHEYVLKMVANGFYEESKNGVVDYDISRYYGKRPILTLGKPRIAQQLCTMGFSSETNFAKEYTEEMVEAAMQLGAASVEEARKELKDVVALMIEVYKAGTCMNLFDDHPPGTISTPTTVGYDRNDNLQTTLGEIEAVFGGHLPGHPPSWTSFFSKWLKPFNVHVGDADLIDIQDISYMKDISQILEKYEHRKRVVSNYFGWLIVKADLHHLNRMAQNVGLNLKRLDCKYSTKAKFQDSTTCNHQYRKRDYVKNKKLNDKKSKVGFHLSYNFWVERCFNWNDEEFTIDDILPMQSSAMKMLLQSMYIRNTRKIQQKPHVKSMTKRLRVAFYRIIEQGNWMDHSTKEAALKKLNAMTQMILYKDKLVNQTLIDGYFKGKTHR